MRVRFSQEARKSGHNHVGTEQMLLGMIGEGSGIAAKILKAHGMDLKTTREEVRGRTSEGIGGTLPKHAWLRGFFFERQDCPKRVGSSAPSRSSPGFCSTTIAPRC